MKKSRTEVLGPRLRQKGVEIQGDFVLQIQTGSKNLEMITLQDAEKRGLKETGDLTLAVAPCSDRLGATAQIPENEIPLNAVAYRIGSYQQRVNHTSGETEVFIPVAFYRV